MAKVEIENFLTVEINQRAADVLAALAGAREGNGPQPLSWTDTMNAVALIAATMIDAEPTLRTRRDMRKYVEELGSTILTLADQFRLMTNATGQTHLDRLGGTTARIN